MNKVIYITPIFNFYFDEQEKPLTHTFSHKGLSYTVVFEEIPYGEKNDERISEMDRPVREQYQSITKLENSIGNTEARGRVMLSTESTNNIDNTISSVNRAFLRAISLHSTNGLLYDWTLIRTNVNDIDEANSKQSGINKQDRWREIEEPSTLKVSDFKDCIKTFEMLLNDNYKTNRIFNNVLKLSLNYHEMLFLNDHTPTKFLLLMIIFEALCCKDHNTQISDGATILSKLLFSDKDEQAVVVNDFHNFSDAKDVRSFRVLRNMIAHGDPNIDEKLPNGRYEKLYKYVGKGLIKVLHIPNEEIGEKDNYYVKLEKITKNVV